MTADKVGVLVREEGLKHGIELSEKQVGQFCAYLKLIQQWQRTVVRLVGNDEATVLVANHVADAFRVYRCVEVWRGKRAVDIGSGAGFPGICVKIVEPELHATLIDTRAKKVAFLTKVAADLGLEGVEVVRGRAEQLAHEARFREQFDIAVMRGVAVLERAIEIGLGFVRIGGELLVRRGKTLREHIAAAEAVSGRCGGGEVVVRRDAVGEGRSPGTCIAVTKVRETKGQYPRARGITREDSLVIE
jgi:16S rRNA (guanine527-N7)-methyltransferase